jgi:hypothetical protein
MFDYVSTREIQLLSQLQLPGYESCLSSNQRTRFEFLGLIEDGPDGVRLTPKGLRVAKVGDVSGNRSEFVPFAEAESLRVHLGKILS